MRICICGGGSLSHVLVGVLGANESIEVRLLTRRPQNWCKTIRVLYRDEAELRGTLCYASHEAKEVIPGADVVILSVPMFARPQVLERIRPYLSERTWVGAFPGFGGFDWLGRAILGERVRLFGSQRVPYVCRTRDYGECVHLTGIRPQTFIASHPATQVNEISALLGSVLNLRVVPMGNYMCVALSPSNPIFHPSRIYSLFGDWHPGKAFASPPRFYEDWNEAATSVFVALDRELQAICAALPLDTAYVKPIVQHYEVASVRDLTSKIRNISALRGRLVPMRAVSGGYVPDFTSSYFVEDIPYGLLVLRGIAQITGMQTPMMDAILMWAERMLGKRYLANDEPMANGEFMGIDARELPLPQNYNLHTMEALVNYALS